MNPLHQVYTTPVISDPTSFAIHRRDARDLATFDLLQELELLQWDRLRMIDSGASADSIAIADSALQAMRTELDTRRRLLQRYRDDRTAPRWPSTSSERYQQLRQTARDLKAVWPIERFAAVVMAVDLRPAGRSLVGLCPLPDHDDRTPSFHVYPPDDRWHCYGCNRGGDIFDLAGLYFRVDSFRERLERVKEASPALIGGAA